MVDRFVNILPQVYLKIILLPSAGLLSSCLRSSLNFSWGKQKHDWTLRLFLELCIPTLFSSSKMLFLLFCKVWMVYLQWGRQWLLLVQWMSTHRWRMFDMCKRSEQMCINKRWILLQILLIHFKILSIWSRKSITGWGLDSPISKLSYFTV